MDTFEAHRSEIVKVSVGLPDVFLGKDLIDVVTEMMGNLPALHLQVGKVCVTGKDADLQLRGLKLGVPFSEMMLDSLLWSWASRSRTFDLQEQGMLLD